MGTTLLGCIRGSLWGGQKTSMCRLLGAPPGVGVTDEHPDECGDPSVVRH